MKITFVIPNVELSGGMKAVFEFSNNLKKLGHEVKIVYPLLPYVGGRRWFELKHQAARIIFLIRRIFEPVYPTWFDVNVDVRRVPVISNLFVPDADVVMATWWETAYDVEKLSMKKGEKFYLVQHYEIWGGPKKMVDGSYRLGLKNVINSGWLKKY